MLAWETYLSKIYHNPKHPASYSGVAKLYGFIKKDGKYKISRKQVRDWLSKQDGYSLRRHVNRKFKRRKVVVRGIDYQWDIDLAFLKKYELRRKTLNASMIRGVDFLFNLFQQDNPYFRLGRNSGLKMVDKLSFLKKNFILHASGIQKILKAYFLFQ
mgnify:CR=1 FL=1